MDAAIRFSLKRSYLGLCLFACPLAFAQEYPASDYTAVHGLFEQFFTADRSGRGIKSQMGFWQLTTNLSPTTQFVTSYLQQGDDHAVDELYGQLDTGPVVFRAGRFRSAFGFSNWSEMHYNPIIALPLVRAYNQAVAPDISLNRLDRGLDVRGGSPTIQYQIAVVDSSDNDWQVVPETLHSTVARLQASMGPVMLGLNGFAKINGGDLSEKRIIGADLRWTGRRTQLRGEIIKGLGKTEGSSGYYVDLFYRPERLARTQLGARIQGFHSLDTGSKAQLATFGVRQFITPVLTLNVNYGIGSNVPEAQTSLGWSVQLLSSLRF